MSTTWYAKIDCNFHSNRKAMKAGRIGREVYVFVLCLNAQRGAVGELPADDLEPWYVAQQLQMEEAEALAGIAACVHAGLIQIDDGTVTICGWTEDYSKYPLLSSEKQKRYRERHKERKTANQNVTGVTVVGNGEVTPLPSVDRTLPPVTQVGRKEGREGEEGSRIQPPVSTSTVFDPVAPASRGRLAQTIWARMSELRTTLAAAFGMQGVLPLTPITPASANQRGYRDLVNRIAEEGPNAPTICDRVLEVLEAQAREKRSLDWISEKAFSEGAWRTARESVPKRTRATLDQSTITFQYGDVEVKA